MQRHRVCVTDTDKENTKCFKDPMYVIFLKSRGFNDFKYDMDMNVSDMAVMDVVDTKTNIKTKTQTKTNTKCFKDPMYVIFLKSTSFKVFKYDMDMDM